MLVNGQPSGTVPADDRGLAYGDGLFETMRARRGVLPLLDYHLERLQAGLRVLEFPDLPEPELRRELRTAARAHPDGIVKLIVTRGSGRGFRAPPGGEARRIVMSMPAGDEPGTWREQGVILRYCRTLLEGPRALAGLKHLNRLPQVLARAEWNDAGIHEGLMRDTAGRVIEGTMSNFFLVRNEELITPPVGAGVSGVMRRLVLETGAAMGTAICERFVTDAEIETANEIFITNAVIGICPVRQIGDRRHGVGTMTRRLQDAVESELERRACSDD